VRRDGASKPTPGLSWRIASTTDPIRITIERWRGYLRSHDPADLAALLSDDVVFLSPVVFTPQVGREITMLYLQAAGQALPGESTKDGTAGSSSFRYTKEVLDGHVAVLEFETTVEDKYVNGVDIITCDDAGLIIEFRVMIRPLQGVNAVHRQMAATLERLSDH